MTITTNVLTPLEYGIMGSFRELSALAVKRPPNARKHLLGGNCSSGFLGQQFKMCHTSVYDFTLKTTAHLKMFSGTKKKFLSYRIQSNNRSTIQNIFWDMDFFEIVVTYLDDPEYVG